MANQNNRRNNIKKTVCSTHRFFVDFRYKICEFCNITNKDAPFTQQVKHNEAPTGFMYLMHLYDERWTWDDIWRKVGCVFLIVSEWIVKMILKHCIWGKKQNKKTKQTTTTYEYSSKRKFCLHEKRAQTGCFSESCISLWKTWLHYC